MYFAPKISLRVLPGSMDCQWIEATAFHLERVRLHSFPFIPCGLIMPCISITHSNWKAMQMKHSHQFAYSIRKGYQFIHVSTSPLIRVLLVVAYSLQSLSCSVSILFLLHGFLSYWVSIFSESHTLSFFINSGWFNVLNRHLSFQPILLFNHLCFSWRSFCLSQ